MKTVSLSDYIETTLKRVQQARDSLDLNKPTHEELWDELGTAESALLNALVLLS